MKKGWAIKRLGDVCEFDKAQGIHCGLPYVGLEHIESHTARFIGSNEPLAVKSSTFKFTPEHVLYGRLRPYLNKALAPDFEGHCSTEIFPIKPAPQLSREYLLYWLLSDETVERINETCTGARMPRADMKDVLEFEFPLPPRAEQQRIVGVLDEAFAGLATAQAHAAKNLQNARALFESLLNEAIQGRLILREAGDAPAEGLIKEISKLRNAAIAEGRSKPEKAGQLGSRKYVLLELPSGWECAQLESLTVGISDGVHKKPRYVSEGIPFITVKNLTAGPSISFDDLSYITREDHEEFIKRTHPENGDILITKDGTIGVVRLIETDIEFSIFVSVALIKPVMREIAPFLGYALRAACVQSQIIPQGAALKHLYLVDLRRLVIPCPPLAEQNRIVEVLDAFAAETQRLESLYQQKQAALAALKKSLLHQAFTGEQ